MPSTATPVLLPSLYIVVAEAPHKANRGPLKGNVSARKALQVYRGRLRSWWEEQKKIEFRDPKEGSLSIDLPSMHPNENLALNLQ